MVDIALGNRPQILRKRARKWLFDWGLAAAADLLKEKAAQPSKEDVAYSQLGPPSSETHDYPGTAMFLGSDSNR